MKKILFALSLVASLLYAEKPPTGVMQFNSFILDEYFTFKINPIKTIPCKFEQIELITLKDRPECLKKKKAIEAYKKDHKKAIENLLKPGKSYYVTLLENQKTYYICSVSDNKKNLSQLLVERGFAMPNTSNKFLLELAKKARKEARGMFGGDFKLIGECIVDGTPIPGQEEPDEKVTYYSY
ncbi:thermonuclease family protein [Campylobacter geochelonis]|uniref:TNase-like domain-containing protein n=1 Tax=Campylobacter geochelonis TaxID=1780362 RepID=A0A128EF35_9BACT|nr:thermonuclease family protein [Campylobacter geochelonis]QKF71778.1 hypothetical protein CGEO_1493 [Campylobacter geochelonis]CZE47534.1 Uncharacterised protein [Campylobacter geochelonis]